MFGKLTALLAAALLLAGCGERCEKTSPSHGDDAFRIVALAPNVTEILYALGLGSQVVGVSRYTVYPPEAVEKPSVGGTYDPNWEMIVSLQPDLVIGLDSQKEIAAQLSWLGIDFLGVPHERIDEVMQSTLLIGKACGAEAEALQLFQRLEKQIAKLSKGRARSPSEPRTSQRNVPTVLVCIGHDEQLTRMYVAGRNTFYDDLIALAGGTNACEQTAVKYPEISPEGLRAMNPDLVIDLVPNPGKNPADFSRHWKPYPVVIMTNSYAFIPGPRFGLLLEDFNQAIQEIESK